MVKLPEIRYVLSVSSITKEQEREWVLAWERAGKAMEHLRAEALKKLSESESARIFDGFDSPFPPVQRESSGLVEQQRYFRKLHSPPSE